MFGGDRVKGAEQTHKDFCDQGGKKRENGGELGARDLSWEGFNGWGEGVIGKEGGGLLPIGGKKGKDHHH